MGLVLFLIFFLFLLTTVSAIKDNTLSSCTSILQDEKHPSNGSGIHLTLHHIHSPCSPVTSPHLPLIDLLNLDETRSQSLNNILTKPNITTPSISKSTNLIPESIGIPLNPGQSIGVGNYVIKLGLGTPPKYFSVIMDTGSSFNWVQCDPCVVYCHPQVGPRFNPSTSSTYKKLSCNTPDCSALEAATLNPSACTRSNICIYQSSYGDGSFSVGYLSSETLTVGPSQTLPGFIYGCGQDNKGLFGRSAGIFGLARSRLSLVSQLSAKYGYVFSYCLPTPSSIGTLSIGQSTYNPSIYKFTRMYSDQRAPSLYFLRISSITVSGKALPLSVAVYTRTPTIIDSGTVITRLPSAVYVPLRTAFVKAMAGYKRAPPFSILDTCFEGGVRGKHVPEVRLIFEGGSELRLAAQNTVIEVDGGVTCLAFAESTSLAIIGNLQQQTYKVVYDISSSKIGFAAGGCG
ncbi:aspartyl protease family protein At5g10770-like [Magnolia sinica]|uniref:aspartyl protease family protein At5g10770-like n=1 Tax=Magnolia sinica TaxID=86752 RepID=UPI00265941D6|nr:aspartyl protease family protein At5g10770-like [Magnolia sinica]